MVRCEARRTKLSQNNNDINQIRNDALLLCIMNLMLSVPKCVLTVHDEQETMTSVLKFQTVLHKV